MQRFLPLLICFLSSLTLFAQVTWDGGGNGTSWEDPLNWDNDLVPVATDLVVFTTSVDVDGTAPNPVVQVRLADNAAVTLGLDLTVGDGTTDEHAVVLGPGSRLVLANTQTYLINPPATKNGIFVTAAADGATINIQGSANVQITSPASGIVFGNATASIVHRGTLTVSDAASAGLRINAGNFENRGDITITNAGIGIDNDDVFFNERGTVTISGSGNRGIVNTASGTFTNMETISVDGSGVSSDGIQTEGAFLNMENSTITVLGATDDQVEVVAGSFTNDGTLTVTASAAGGANNAALAVGTDATTASFFNTSNNSLVADGGTGTDVRTISIFPGSSFDNTGTVTVSGGDESMRIDNDGDFTNNIGGTLELGDGRINTSSNLTNNGVIRSSRAMGAGVFNMGTVTNNAFYAYDNGNTFSSGSGTETDLGINLNQFSERVIDADGACTIDIAEVMYDYELMGSYLATSTTTGSFTFPNMIMDDAVNLSPVGLAGVTIRVRNPCNANLPVEITRIEAVSTPKSILVEWATATESDNDYMAVEHGTDGTTFREIGRVNGSGTTLVSRAYELEDRQPTVGTNFYRLRQVDFDGTASYSEIVSADFSGTSATSGQLSVYPTLLGSGQTLTVDLRNEDAATTSRYYLIDGNGRTVRSFELTGGQVRQLLPGQLSAGLYLLTNRDGEEVRQARIIIH